MLLAALALPVWAVIAASVVTLVLLVAA